MSLPGKIIRFDATNNECVECTNNAKLKNQEWVCAEACGADNECDERADGTFIGRTCSNCQFSGISCPPDYNDANIAIVCGTIPASCGTLEANRQYELRINRTSAVVTCGTDMSGFSLTYVAAYGYELKHSFAVAQINNIPGRNNNLNLNNCIVDLEFRFT